MTDNNEQIMIDTNKYFVELIDKGGGTVGYTVVFPERLLIEIIKQNKQLARKTQECEKLREANDEKNEFLKKLGISATGEFHRIKYYTDKLHQECEKLKKKKEEKETFYLTKYANRDSDCLELEHKLKQAEQKLERISEFIKTFDEEDEVRIIILKIIDEVE